MPSVFISYTHSDKLIAQRVARRLTAFEIKVWLDERELRLGAALEPTIERHINDCDVVVPIATAAAAKSKWVAKEIAFATKQNPDKSICPLLVEPVETDPLFAPHLGLNATDPHTFESKLLTLARALLGDLPEPDQARLLDDVRAAAAQEPALSILVDACLSGPGLSNTNFDTVAALPDHLLDYAINAMFDGCEGEERTRVAWHAAHLFTRRGVGFYALDKYARREDADRVVLDSAVGRPLAASHHASALNIIASCATRHDGMLASFVFHNSQSLSPDDTTTVVRLVSFPHRKARDATVSAALQAIQLVPTSDDLLRLWIRWIDDGQFDGVDRELVTQRQAVKDVGTILAIPSRDWTPITEAFKGHMRELARTQDRHSVEVAVNYLKTAADEQSPLLSIVRGELNAAIGSAEWDGWADRDERSIYVSEHVTAANGDRDWLGAVERYQTSWQAVKDLNAFLDKKSST